MKHPTTHAIAQLEISLDIVKSNIPINEARGDWDQAKLERECAKSYRAAIKVLKAAERAKGLTA